MTDDQQEPTSTHADIDKRIAHEEVSYQAVVSGPPKNKKKWIIIGVICLLIIGIAVAAWFLFLKDDSKQAAPSGSTPKTNADGSQDFTLAPRFNHVAAYASFAQAEWYAADGGIIRLQAGKQPAYYTAREGLPDGVVTSLVVHKDKLWVGAQNGVAVLKADASGFDPATKVDGLENGMLYEDTYAGKLYLTGFDRLYVYNDTSNKWDGIAGPKNFHTMAISKDFITATVNGQGMQVWVYTKATNTWAVQKPAGIDDDALQETFAMGNDLFVIGRGKGYKSCEQQGKIVASAAYHLDQSGVWQPLAAFNGDLARPELILARHVKDPTTVLYVSPCDDASAATKYKVSYADNTLKLDKAGTVSSTAFRGNDDEQQDVVDLLSQATGLYPFIRVLEADKNGNLVFAYAKRADASTAITTKDLAIAKGSDFTKATPIQIDSKVSYDTAAPIMCDGTLSYIFIGKQAYGSVAQEGFPNGDWESAHILKVDGNKAALYVDLQGNVSEPRFACASGKMSWVGKTTVQQLDIAAKKVSSVGTGLPAGKAQQTQSVYPLANGDLWALLPVDAAKNDTQATLYHFAAATNELKKVGTYTAVALLGGTPTQAWVAEKYGNQGGDVFDGLAVYDQTGKKTSRAGLFLRVGLTGTGAVVATASPDNSIFIPASFVTYTAGGNDMPIDAQKVSVRRLRLGTAPDGFAYAHNDGVYDAKHRRIWFNDDQLGSFAIAP